MYKLTYLEALFSSILWLILFIKYKSAFQIQNQNKGNYQFFTIALLVFAVFGFISGADFFSYYEGYEICYKTGSQYWEPFYQFLIEKLPYGYYYWRFVIWGLSTIFVVLIFKRLKTPPFLSCLIFILIPIFHFPALRNVLGYVALYYSATYILKPTKNKVLSYFVGFVGILLSTTLHKSMPLYICILLASFFPLKKWMYIVALCAFPILYSMFYEISVYVLTSGIGSSDFQTYGGYYLEDDNFAAANILGYIRLFVFRFPLILLLYYSIHRIYKEKITDKSIIVFSQYTFWLMYISCLFFNQDTSSFLSPRFWDACLYPLAIVLPMTLYNQKSKVIIFSFYLLIAANLLYKIMYPIYKI